MSTTQLIIVQLLAACMGAQAQSVALSGVVRDRSGAPLPRAKIVLQEENERSDELVAFSDDEGKYRFNEAPNGVYYLEARREGFLSVRYHPIYLEYPVEKTANFDLPLNPREVWSPHYPSPSFYTHAVVSGELMLEGQRARNARLCALRGEDRICTTTNTLGQYSFEVPPG